MKKFLLLVAMSVSVLMGGNLSVVTGVVKAHTEVFGDSQIDPETSGITSHLSIAEGIESLSGSVDISMKGLRSDEESRDENMMETIESEKFPFATYTLTKVEKVEIGYLIHGVLDFHGVKNPLTMVVDIEQEGKTVMIKGKSSFKMSSFGVEPPVLLFLTVRDKVDIIVDATFKEE